MEADVTQTTPEFYITGVLAPNINSNLIVLIPKVTRAQAMGDFCLIALADFSV